MITELKIHFLLQRKQETLGYEGSCEVMSPSLIFFMEVDII